MRQPDTILLLFALAKGVATLSGWVTRARNSRDDVSNENVRDVKRNDNSRAIIESRRNWREMTRGISSIIRRVI